MAKIMDDAYSKMLSTLQATRTRNMDTGLKQQFEKQLVSHTVFGGYNSMILGKDFEFKTVFSLLCFVVESKQTREKLSPAMNQTRFDSGVNTEQCELNTEFSL